MNHSVTEAARVVGKSRMTIIRAIAAGTLSASRAEPGKPWMIDAAELARVFPSSDHVPNHGPNTGLPRSGDAPPNHPDHEEVKNALILEQRQTIDDLRRRLDEERTDRRQAQQQLAAAQERIAALLTDQRPAPGAPAQGSRMNVSPAAD
jgi:hypothetical protein